MFHEILAARQTRKPPGQINAINKTYGFIPEPDCELILAK
jgi:hypothetical protein